MDIVIEELIIEEDRPEHIAKHNVSGEGKESRVLITGQTSNNRLLTVLLGKRKGRNKYGLVTARDAKKKEDTWTVQGIIKRGFLR